MSTNNQSGKSRLGLILSVIVVMSIVGVGTLTFTKRQVISDWWSLRNYTPPTSISNLADETTMTAKSRHYFYLAHPEVDNRVAFNQNCSVNQEKTIVLGCYLSNTSRIYLFSVNDPKLNGVEEVTAAHETLHAIYARLSTSQRVYVDGLIKKQMTKLHGDQHLQQLISIYNQQEPGELLNEMHSILGTEYGNLDPALEQYYSQYFTNRKAVVDYANGYKQVFSQMQMRLSQDEQLLRDLKQQITNLERYILAQKTTLYNKQAQLDLLRQTDPNGYNAQVPSYNNMVNSFNATVAQYKNLISQYNALVRSHNNIAIDYNDLNNELNSHYQPISQ